MNQRRLANRNPLPTSRYLDRKSQLCLFLSFDGGDDRNNGKIRARLKTLEGLRGGARFSADHIADDRRQWLLHLRGIR